MRDGDSFKVAGVPASLVEEFSKRRAQIVEALAEKGYSSARAAEVAALDTRAAKGEISREELFQQWQETALAHGFSAENVQQLRQLQEQLAQVEEQDPLSPEALFAKLTETDSAFTIHKIYQAVAVAAQGKLDTGQIEARVQDLLADPEMVKLRRLTPTEEIKDKRNPRAGERHYSTRAMVDLEKAMAARVGQLASASSHEVRHEAAEAAMKVYELEKGFQLSAEQRAAVLHITTGGQLAAVRGAAGAGKTTFMGPARAAWESAGYRVRGAALAGKAAAGMEAVGIKSQTVHSLLAGLDGGWKERERKLQESAAAADKAVADGLAAGRQPSEKLLIWQAGTQAELEEHRAREVTNRDVILVDEAGMIGSRQMSALMQHAEKIGFKLVLVGDEKQLQAVAAGGAFQVVQREAGYAELADNRRQRDAADREAARAVVAGQAGEALRSYLDRDRIHINADQREAAAQMVKDWAGSESRASEKLMLAKTRAEVRLLNDLAREEMKNAGKLINAVTFTAAAGQREFAEGDRLLFTKNDLELRVKNGHLSTIEKIDFGLQGHARIHVRMDHDGSLVTITPGLAQGKQKEPFTHFEYGYAVTTHKAQGVTVDRAFVLGLGDREMGYVQMTRHRDACHIYITAQEIDKLEEAAEVALAEEFGDAEATPKMLDFMQQIAARRGIAPSLATDFVSVRLWLDQHSPVQLGLEQDAGEQGQKEKEDTDPRMVRLRGAITSLETSHQKGTTLDYTEEEDGTREIPKDMEEQIKMQEENAELAVAGGRIPEKTDTHQSRHEPAQGPELQLEHAP
jgi:ATP-dependent exoDNAse (exonuclease V) alpha subunit